MVMVRKTTSKRRKAEKEKRGNQTSFQNEKADHLGGHRQDSCQCHLRRGIFLPPGVDEEEMNNLQDTRKE